MAITGLEHRVINTVGNEGWIRDSGLPLHQVVQLVFLFSYFVGCDCFNLVYNEACRLMMLVVWSKGIVAAWACRQQPRRSTSGDKGHWVDNSRGLVIVCFEKLVYAASLSSMMKRRPVLN
jgi:hypothetical protein